MKRNLRFIHLILIPFFSICINTQLEAQYSSSDVYSLSVTTVKKGEEKPHRLTYDGYKAYHFDIENYLLRNLNHKNWIFYRITTDTVQHTYRFNPNEDIDISQVRHFCLEHVETEKIALLGVNVSDTPDFNGVFIDGILDNPTTDAHVFEVGDIIIQVNQDTIYNTCDLTKAIIKHNVGDFVTIQVLRGNQIIELQVSLGYRISHTYYWIPCEDQVDEPFEKPGKGESPINLFPNPNTGAFQVQFHSKSKEDISIQILDILGEVVYTEMVADFGGWYNRPIFLNHIASGMYVIYIKQGKRTFEQKMVIQRF